MGRVSFWGTNCVRDFVHFIIANGYYQSIYTKDFTEGTREALYSKKVHNVFVAHNGFNFDFRFLYEELFAHLGHFEIVGDIQQTKSMNGRGIQFLDTALMLTGTLSSLAKIFFKNDPSFVKYDSTDVVGLTFEEYSALTEAKIVKIKDYCE